MGSLLTLEEWTERTVMPPEDVDIVEGKRPGFIVRRLTHWTSWIEARLRKRYPIAFKTPYPDVILGWLTDIVTLEAYEARGWDPSDAQSARIAAAHDDAKKDVVEAANGQVGLFDLPVSQENNASAVEKGGPLGYSEALPWEWMDRQAGVTRGR